MLGSKAAGLLATLALTVGSVTWVVAMAPPASACPTDTDNDCYNSAYGYWRVQNTDSSGLFEHTRPDINSPTTGSLPNGTNIEVHCQVNGSTDPYDPDYQDGDGDGLQYTVWDRLENGFWVYDGIFVSSPGDGFHIVLNHC